MTRGECCAGALLSCAPPKPAIMSSPATWKTWPPCCPVACREDPEEFVEQRDDLRRRQALGKGGVACEDLRTGR